MTVGASASRAFIASPISAAIRVVSRPLAAASATSAVTSPEPASTALRIECTRASMSSALAAADSASAEISRATTAKPRPASPAFSASIWALIDSRFVRLATRAIATSTPSTASPCRSISSKRCRIDCARASKDRIAASMRARPSTLARLASPRPALASRSEASVAARRLPLSAMPLALAVTSATVATVDCAEPRSSLARRCIRSVAPTTSPTVPFTSERIVPRELAIVRSAAPSRRGSRAPAIGTAVARSPPARRVAAASRACNGRA